MFGFGLIDSEHALRGAQPYKEMEFGGNSRAYPGQNKVFWLNETEQFKKDFFYDEYELDKAIKRVRNYNSESYQELINLKNEMKKASTPISYYNDLRPRILKAISSS